MTELLELQNSIDYQDVVTISAFMPTDAELAKHVEAVRGQNARRDARKERSLVESAKCV